MHSHGGVRKKTNSNSHAICHVESIKALRTIGL